MKKLFSALMAAAMALSITTAALADTPAGDVVADGEVALPTIDVTVCGVDPTSHGTKLFVNPYGYQLKVHTVDNALQAATLAVSELASSEEDYEGDDKIITYTDKVFSPTYWLENNTTMALDVYVNGSATIKTGSTMTLSKIPLVSTSTKKEAFIYASFSSTYTSSEVGTGDDAHVVVTDFTPATLVASNYDATAPSGSNFVINTTEAKKAQNVGTLNGSTGSNTQRLAFGFRGDAVSEPSTAWVGSGDTADGLTATLVFTYKPHVEPPAQNP